MWGVTFPVPPLRGKGHGTGDRGEIRRLMTAEVAAQRAPKQALEFDYLGRAFNGT